MAAVVLPGGLPSRRHGHGFRKLNGDAKVDADLANCIAKIFIGVLGIGASIADYDRAASTKHHFVCRPGWKWRKRSSVKITERAREEIKKALHWRREGRHFEATFAGAGAGFQAL